MRPVSKKVIRSKQPKKAEADRKAKEETEWANKAADRKAKEEADSKTFEEADRIAFEEADRRAAALTPAQVEEANRILAMVTARSKGGGKRAKCMAKEAADHKEKEEADRKTLEEADRPTQSQFACHLCFPEANLTVFSKADLLLFFRERLARRLVPWCFIDAIIIIIIIEFADIVN